MSEQKHDEFTATGSHRVWNPAIMPSRIPTAPPASSRHAGITRSLKNFPSYKSWTDKVKNNWKPDKE